MTSSGNILVTLLLALSLLLSAAVLILSALPLRGTVGAVEQEQIRCRIYVARSDYLTPPASDDRTYIHLQYASENMESDLLATTVTVIIPMTLNSIVANLLSENTSAVVLISSPTTSSALHRYQLEAFEALRSVMPGNLIQKILSDPQELESYLTQPRSSAYSPPGSFSSQCDRFELVDRAVRKWKEILLRNRNSSTAEFELSARAMNLSPRWWKLQQPMRIRNETVNTELTSHLFASGNACRSDLQHSPSESPDGSRNHGPSPSPSLLRVMTYNMWYGGEGVRLPLEDTARTLLHSGADIIGLQEVIGYAEENVSTVLPRLLDLMTVSGLENSWNRDSTYSFDQGTPLWSEVTPSPIAIISKYPIVQSSPGKWGCKIQLSDPNRFLWIFNVHLPYAPYQPYQVMHLPYREQDPNLDSEAEAIESARVARSAHLESLSRDMKTSVASSTDDLVLLTGDFNEPSPYDWTDESVIAGFHPLRIEWPSADFIESQTGLAELFSQYRSHILKQSEIQKAAWTWTMRTSEWDPTDHHDRIDFIFAGTLNKSETAARRWWSVAEMLILGEQWPPADRIWKPWTSDHRAMLAEFCMK